MATTTRMGSTKPKPNLSRALDVGRASWATDTIAYAGVLMLAWDEDRSFSDWIGELEAYDRAHRVVPIRRQLALVPKGA